MPSDKKSLSQVDASLVHGLIHAPSNATSKYFIQSLLRFGSHCEKAMRNENEGPVEMAIALAQIPDLQSSQKVVLVLTFEPIALRLWTYRVSEQEFCLTNHFDDLGAIEKELEGSGLETLCFNVQSDFKCFEKLNGRASWDRLLDFAYCLDLDEERPSVQLLESQSLYESTFESLSSKSKSKTLQEIAAQTSTELDFEADAIGWFDSVLKKDLTESLDSVNSERLRQFLADQR